MPTKLSRYMDGIMEASWLAAVMLVPVFFNIYSSRIFEPDKLTLLRTLSLIILAAWVIKLLEEGGFRGEQVVGEIRGIKTFLKIPLILPVLALAFSYILSTLLSVTTYTSLWGSYQRLQGTYTTFSYLVIFFSMIINLRKGAQVERLIAVAVISSLPVSLYGILQRYHADPIPWGGDVTQRIAANMGNSIFVAAYLIMVLPLTILQTVESFEALLKDRGRLWSNFARATIFVFVLALQAIAIYFSGSRGPWLGLGASLVIIWLGLSLVWRKRWLTVTGVVIAVLAGGFLLTLNIPNGPLENMRRRPEFGRLGELLDSESRTGRVRSLIWQGAAELVRSTDPIEFPNGKEDPFSFLRPLIGYGPEAMYVAYNRFYPPELTRVEKRNASPDRSHNETWDSLVITGVLGLVIYLGLFGSLFYYGLKWLGLVPGKRQRNLYLALFLLGGLVSSVVFTNWKGAPFLGVALPFGTIVGAILYMVYISLFGRKVGLGEISSEEEKLHVYLLLGLLAAVTAHFVEINFGIAIAATRTYFWIYAALILLTGYILPKHGQYISPAGEAVLQSNNVAPAQETVLSTAPGQMHGRKNSSASSRRSDRARKSSVRRSTTSTSMPALPKWLREALVAGLIVALLLATLGYEFVTNAAQKTSAFQLVWSSLASYARAGSRNGVLPLLITTWLAGVILLVSEKAQSLRETSSQSLNAWLRAIGVAAGVSMVLAGLCWLWNASGLVALARETAQSLEDILGQVRRSEDILTLYYVQALIFLFILSGLLPEEWPARKYRNGALSTASAFVILVIALMVSSYTNLRVIQADIAFKTGDLFAKPDSWPAAIAIYNRANDLAPNEDYYYLFLGRAYLEYAKTLPDNPDREQLIEAAAKDLKKAQEINPLNTDHTANLARLYSLWATFTQDPALREARARTSDDYFTKALILSPNNARLWDEWAVLQLSLLSQPEIGLEKLQRSLELDPYYDWTYALLGDYYSRVVSNQNSNDPAKKNEALQVAANYYNKALELGEGSTTTQLKYNYAIALGGIRAELANLGEAISAYEKAIGYIPDSSERWRIEATLAQLYSQQGDLAKALEHAQIALSLAPEDQKQNLQNVVQQLGGQP